MRSHDFDVNWHDIEKDPPPYNNHSYFVCGIEQLPGNVRVKHFAVLRKGVKGGFIQTGNWSKYTITHWALISMP